MSRRSGNILIELARLPWWASAVLAATTFVALRWVAPALVESRPTLMALAEVAARLAPWLALVFLLPVPVSVLTALRRRRLAALPPRLERLRAISWREFEELVAEHYRQRGYRVVERGGGGADGGIDLVLRAAGKTIVVQCKRWQARAVGVALVRELYGAMTGEQADAAVFITTGQYTPDALDFARDKPIQLIDGAELASMLGRAKGLTAAPTETDAGSAATPLVVTTRQGPVTCPRCGRAMVRRVARQGTHAGDPFWGCTGFPGCRGTRAV